MGDTYYHVREQVLKYCPTADDGTVNERHKEVQLNAESPDQRGESYKMSIVVMIGVQ